MALTRRFHVPSMLAPVSHGHNGWRGPARPGPAGRVTIRLFGVPERFAASLGLVTA
jgi:hypothetical protein